ncbi:MAG: hypothetical protein ACYC3H_05200 [Bellilinea sp.]
MSESNIDIILRTKREGDAPQETVDDLQAMKGGLTDLEKAMAGTRSTVGSLDKDINLFGTNVGSTADLLSGMGISIPISPMQLFGTAIQATGNFLKESINDYTAYVEEVDRIATYSGMASEETSKLIQVADDLRIETGTLEMALKTMAQNGTTPSIQGIGELSDKYRNIQDPLQRAQFLTDNFGRSGMEMARMMELGSDKVQDLTDAVADYMIITGQSKEEAEDYLLAVDDLGDSWMGFKYQIGAAVIPPLTDLLNRIVDHNEAVEEGGAKWMKWVPFLAQVRAAFLDTKAWMENTTDSVSAQSDELGGLESSWNNASKAAQNYSSQIENSGLKPSKYCGIPGHPDRPHSHGSENTYWPTNGGGKAEGGNVTPGTIYKVGEREVEYYTFPIQGAIVPQGGGGGQPIIFNYQPIVSLADREEAERVLIPFIKKALRQQ